MTAASGPEAPGAGSPFESKISQMAIVVATLHLCWCPFTKVEESHALQATHDLLYHRSNLSQYDHHEFPGVVPRSFLGPLILSIFSSPIVFLIQIFDCNKFWSQYIVRLVLAFCVILSWCRLRDSLVKIFGNSFALWFTVVTVTQYHFMFYLSRTLPNIIVMPLVLLAMDFWINGKHNLFIYASGTAIIIFRAELALLLGQFLLYDLYLKRISLVRLLKLAIPTAIVLIALTVGVDSFFWSRLTWPEAEVFWFNSVLNKSSEWGTSPFLWYWYSALPRGLGPSLFLIPFGIYFDRRIIAFVTPALTFVSMFSFLPHKELRFVIYVFPLLNVAIASACKYIWERRSKTTLYQTLNVGVILCLIGNSMLSLTFLSVATTNYPGGAAISRFHRLLKNESFVNVHIDNLAAQTGVTRFTQLNDNWTYSKIESLEPDELQKYTHLIIEAKNKYSPNLKRFLDTHVILDFIDGFSHISINYQSMPPFKIKTKPSLFILERKMWRENPLGLDLPPLKNITSFDVEEDVYTESMEEFDVDVSKGEMSDTETVMASIDGQPNIKQNIKQLIEKYKEDELLEDEYLQKLSNLRENMRKIQTESNINVKKQGMRKRLYSEKEKLNLAASTKQKLKDLIVQHKKDILNKENVKIPDKTSDYIYEYTDSSNDTEAENVPEISDISETENEIDVQPTKPDRDSDITNYLKNLSFDDIVEEVIKKIESKSEGTSEFEMKDLEKDEKRKAIKQMVEEILFEKVNSQKFSSNEDETPPSQTEKLEEKNYDSGFENIEIDDDFIIVDDIEQAKNETDA